MLELRHIFNFFFEVVHCTKNEPHYKCQLSTTIAEVLFRCKRLTYSILHHPLLIERNIENNADKRQSGRRFSVIGPNSVIPEKQILFMQVRRLIAHKGHANPRRHPYPHIHTSKPTSPTPMHPSGSHACSPRSPGQNVKYTLDVILDVSISADHLPPPAFTSTTSCQLLITGYIHDCSSNNSDRKETWLKDRHKPHKYCATLRVSDPTWSHPNGADVISRARCCRGLPFHRRSRPDWALFPPFSFLPWSLQRISVHYLPEKLQRRATWRPPTIWIVFMLQIPLVNDKYFFIKYICIRFLEFPRSGRYVQVKGLREL